MKMTSSFLLPALIWAATVTQPVFASQTLPPKGGGDYHGVFRELPITDIKPEGWLADFLGRQRDGLGLHYAVSGYPFNNSLYVGMPQDHWGRYEEDAYLLDGLYRCGLLLESKELLDLCQKNIDYVLDHPQPDGKLGPSLTTGKEIGSPEWPQLIFNRMLMADYLVTGNKKILDILTRSYLAQAPEFGSNGRDVNNVEVMCWLYGQTGDKRMLDLAEKTYANFTKNPRSQWGIAKMATSAPMKGHGVSICEATKQPALLYLATGKKEYLDAVVGAFKSLERDHELVDGVISSDEGLHGKKPEGVHETCDITDYTWSLGYILQASGDAAWGDKVERAVFNAGFGAIDKEFKGLQYFSSPNQALATETSSEPKFGPANADRQSYRPTFAVQCCTGNVHRMIPNYAARLWMSDNKGGLAATLYGPNTVKTRVGAAQTGISIHEKTDYPFNGAIELTITPEKPVKFPLYLRIPGWAEGATVTVNGQPAAEKPVPGMFLKLDRTFAAGDVVKLDFPMNVRMENPVAGGFSLLRGPLVYSIKLKEKKDKITNGKNLTPEFPAWSVSAASDWNYALDLESADLSKVKVEARPVGAFPWTADAVPVTLTVPVKKIPAWTVTTEGHNPPLPTAPFELASAAEEVQFIPDGATLVRWSVFPLASKASEAAPAPTSAPVAK